MVELEMTSRVSSVHDVDAPRDLERELSYLRRDVERLSLRLRQETERTAELQQALDAERLGREEERTQVAAESESRRVRAEAAELRVKELEGTDGLAQQLAADVNALRVELQWARTVSGASLAVAFGLAAWLIFLAI